MARYTMEIEHDAGQLPLCRIESRKRIDAARNVLRRMVYDAHDSDSTRDSLAAWQNASIAEKWDGIEPVFIKIGLWTITASGSFNLRA